MIPIRKYNIDREELFEMAKNITLEDGESCWKGLHYFEPKIRGVIDDIHIKMKAILKFSKENGIKTIEKDQIDKMIDFVRGEFENWDQRFLDDYRIDRRFGMYSFKLYLFHRNKLISKLKKMNNLIEHLDIVKQLQKDILIEEKEDNMRRKDAKAIFHLPEIHRAWALDNLQIGKFDISQIALYCFYEGEEVNARNYKQIAKRHGIVNAHKLTERYNKVKEKDSRIVGNKLPTDINRIFPLLSEVARIEAKEDFMDYNRKYKRNVVLIETLS
ncbi:hypothetical protein [Marinifilum sp. D737]|uniref:hypothetical protein n=1 Tax=Marinifilum sp. D737 TaxID=2969628 RepID=UPI00227236AB|nr:hypothetical protein [Marinifilum sp. D737]MCY1636400.1 hypothetical protein [Marinifilum sp. D737]